MHFTFDIQHGCRHASDSSPLHYQYIICLVQGSSLGYANVHAAATLVGHGSQPHVTVGQILLCHMTLHLSI